MTRSHILPFLIAVLSIGAFVAGVFFKGLDQPLFTPALLCVLLAALLMLAGGVRKGWDVPAVPAMGLLSLFWLWMVLALSWSSVPQVSTVFTLLIGSMPLLVFATLQHQRAGALIHVQMAALVGVMLLMGVWALIQFFLLYGLVGSRIHHPMLNTNNLAVLLVCAMFPLLLWFSRARGWSCLLYGAGFIVLLMAMLTTESRGGLLGLTFGLGVFVVVCFPLIWNRARSFIWLSASMVSAAVVIFSMIISRSEELRVIGGGNSMASVNERFLLLGAGLRMLLDHPFPGIGLGAFYLAYPPYRNPHDLSDGYFLHVDPIQFGIEMSPVATVLFYAFCTAVLVRTIMAVRQTQDINTRASIVLPFAGLLALMVNTHVNFDLYMLPALMMAGVMVMAWFFATEKSLGARRITLTLHNKAHSVFLIPAIVLLFGIAPIWLVRAGFAVQENALASQALGQGDMPNAKAHIDRAEKFGVPSYFRTYHIDAIWRIQLLKTQFFSLSANQREALFQDSLTLLDKALYYNPYYVHSMNQKALLYTLAYPRLAADGLDRAEDILRDAVALDPLSFDTRLGLAKVLVMKNKSDQALQVLEDGLHWDAVRDYAPLPYRQFLIQLRKESGQNQAADDLIKETYTYIIQSQNRQKARVSLDQWLSEKWKSLLE